LENYAIHKGEFDMDISSLKKCAIALAILATTSTTTLAFQSLKLPFTGAYAGLNAGYSWGNSHTVTDTSLVEGAYFGTTDVEQINGNGSHNLKLNSFTGGGQIGYNYEFGTQYGNFLVGAESDFNTLSGVSDSKNTIVGYISAPGSEFTLSTKTTANWLFTLRPRIGYVYNCTLFYVTAGLAIAEFKTSNSFSDNFSGVGFASNALETDSNSDNKSAGIFGGGIEYMFTPNLSVKAEYLYAKFGKVSSSGNVIISPALAIAFDIPNQNTLNHSADFSTNIFRVGVNYIFS
jgi:outer membrane immunogenic protein